MKILRALLSFIFFPVTFMISEIKDDIIRSVKVLLYMIVVIVVLVPLMLIS